MLKWEGWANVQLSSSDVDAWSGPIKMLSRIRKGTFIKV